jgi:predicted nucleotidyltransferase
LRISRGDVIAGLNALDLRKYFRAYGDGAVSSATAREEFSITKRKAVRLIAELVKLELVRKSEFQPEKNIVRYETTIQGNALALAKAGKPVSRATADRVLQEFLDRVKRVNEQSELAYSVESVVVFGSYLTDRTKLNDLDIGVELTRRGKEKATDEKLQKERIARAFACGRRFGNLVEELFWPRTEVLLILKNRSRVISFCEWESLFHMPGLRYRVLHGNSERIADLIRDGERID